MPADVAESAQSFECAWAARFPMAEAAGEGDGGSGFYKNISCLNCFDSCGADRKRSNNDSDFERVDFLKMWMP